MKKNKKSFLTALMLSIMILIVSVFPTPLLQSAGATSDVVLTVYDRNYLVGSGYTAVDPTLTITGTGNITSAKVYFGSNFNSSTDSLSYPGGSGLTVSYVSSTGTLNISGTATIATYQAFLRGVTASTTATSGTKTVYFSVSQGSSDVLYYSGTGHFYEYVAASGITWTNANTAASSRYYDGHQGYLATITSAEENSFLAEKCAGDGWLGASDNDSEGAWKWVTGPESGTQFWQGASGGSIINNKYNNWHSGEPNNAGNENYLHMYSNDGTWNDFAVDNSSIKGYLVEYGTTSISLTSDTLKASTLTIVSTPSTPVLTVTPSLGSMSLSWPYDSIASSYDVYKNGSFVQNTTSTSYSDTGLSANTQYSYYVVAKNGAGTAPSSTVSKYTLAAVPSITVVKPNT